MKPVRLEVLVDNKTGKGLSSVDKSVAQTTKNFKIEIENQKSFIQDLERQIRSVEKEISRASNDSQKKKLIPSLLEAERELKGAKNSLVELDAQMKKGGSGTVSLRTQMQSLRNQMAEMTEGTDQYADAMRRLGVMQDRYDDITTQGKIFGDDHKNIRAGAEAVSLFSGAMSAGVGAASLFGAEQEKLAQIQVRLQSVMAMTIGIQQVSQALNKDSYFTHVLMRGITNKWASAQKVLNVQLGIGVGMSKALMAGGIGLLIAGTVALISHLRNLNKERKEEQKFQSEAIKTTRTEVVTAQNLERVLKNSNNGYEERRKALDKLKEIMPDYNATLSKEGTLIEDNTGSLTRYIAQLKNAALAKSAMNKVIAAEDSLTEFFDGLNKVQKSTLIRGDSGQLFDEMDKRAYEDLDRMRQKRLDERDKWQKRLEQYTADSILNSGGGEDDSKTPPENKLAEQRLDAMRKLKEQEIALMREGEAKRKAQVAQEYQNKLAEIAKEKKEREKHVQELLKAGMPVAQEEVVAINDQAQQQQLNAKKAYDADMLQIDQETARHLESISNEVRLNFESRLTQQLADLDEYYNKAYIAAEGDAALQAEIEGARNRAKLNARNVQHLAELDLEEQLELQRLNIATVGLDMTETIEQRKNEIIIRYARERISVLKALGDEQSENEIKQLENVIAGLTAKNTQQKTLKGMVDEKAIQALTKHFVKLGDSQEDAEKKSIKFFTDFQGNMQLASELAGTLQGVFGGINEDLDAALGAVSNVASGFATGGIAGGIEAAASELVSAGVKWLSAKREIDEQTIAQYESYLSGMNELIDKQIAMLDQLGGDDFGQNILKTVADINESIRASRALFGEAMKAGSSMWTHSYGYEANRMLKGYTAQLRAAGINTTDLNKMTDEQLVLLKSMPEIFAKLRPQLQEYINDLADGIDKLDEFKQQLQDTILGFDFSTITSMIVDSLTDSSIDNALDSLTSNINGAMAKMVKDMLARQMLIGPIQKMMEDLFNSMDKGGGKYELDVNAAKIFTEGVKNLGEQYEREFNKLKEQFAAQGIDFDSADGSDGGRKAVNKGISSLTQDQGNKLEGQLTNVQGRLMNIDKHVVDMSQWLYRIFDPINRIADNTDRLEAIENSMQQTRDGIEKIVREGINIKR